MEALEIALFLQKNILIYVQHYFNVSIIYYKLYLFIAVQMKTQLQPLYYPLPERLFICSLTITIYRHFVNKLISRVPIK